MDIRRVHPQLRAMARRAPRLNLDSRLVRFVARLGSRYLVPRAKVSGVRVRDVRDGDVRARLYVPDRPSGAAVLWIHGGGMVIGAPQQDDRFCALLASRLGATVVSADYRLAPEHPHPAPVNDSHATWDWLLAHATALGVDPARIAIGGASAGGGIAAALTARLHDEQHTQPAAQWLLYPMLDDRTATRRELDEVDHFVWNNTANRIGWTALLNDLTTPGSTDVPSAAAPARREDLSGLPATWIGVGDIDLFYQEDATYAQRLRAAGVTTAFEVLQGAPHGFESLAPKAPPVRTLLDTGLNWLDKALQPTDDPTSGYPSASS